MRGKLMFLAGLGAGFVLGTRAGREKYEELVQAARKVRENPTVQEAAGVVQEQANKLMAGTKDTLTDKLSQSRLADTKVGERLLSRRESTTTPATTTTPGTTTTSTVTADDLATSGTTVPRTFGNSTG